MRLLTSIFLIIYFSNINFSQGEIDKLVLDKVNQLRDSLNISVLKLDKVLNKAGNDHAYYISRKNELTHFQNTFSKETPSARVEYYQGNRTYVGENVAVVSVQKLKNDSLGKEAVAQSLFNGWLNSPPHYKNMITSDFTMMGIGYATTSNKKLYATQVFSSNEIKLPNEFKNADLSWGVRPSEFTCKDEANTYETMFFANSIQVEGNSIYFYFHDIAFFRNVINNDNDGLAIDIILREQLPCNKENQFHISLVHDGEMQRPIYKNDIFRNDISNNPKKIRIKIGEVPTYLKNKQWEANVIIINNNKLCDYTYPVEVPSAIFPLLDLSPYYDTNDNIDSFFTPFFIKLQDSIHIELLVERSKNRFHAYDLPEFNRLMEWGKFIKKVNVDCFASVEGASWFNTQLLENREKNVINFLLQNNFDFNAITINARENWTAMYAQSEKHQLRMIRDKSKKQIKNYLKRNKSKFLDSLLFEQRKTHIRAKIDTTLEINHFDELKLAQHYDSTILLNALPWNRILREDYILANKRIENELIDSLKTRKELRTNLFGALTIRHSYRFIDSTVVTKLLKNIDTSNSEQLFNYAHFLTNYWFSKYSQSYETKGVAITIVPAELLKIISKIDTNKIKQKDLIRLKVNVLLAGIHYYVAHNNWVPVESYFITISDLIKLNDFSAEEAKELALFCNHFHKFELAVKILHPFHEKQLLSEDGRFVLAKTASLIKQKLDEKQYHDYMKSAKNINLKRYCNWLNKSFQIQRDEYLKQDFCKECKT